VVGGFENGTECWPKNMKCLLLKSRTMRGGRGGLISTRFASKMSGDRRYSKGEDKSGLALSCRVLKQGLRPSREADQHARKDPHRRKEKGKTRARGKAQRNAQGSRDVDHVLRKVAVINTRLLRQRSLKQKKGQAPLFLYVKKCRKGR